MSLEFMDTKEAQEIFSEVRDIAIVKKTAIMIAAQKDGLLSENVALEADEKIKKAKEKVQKQLRNLTVIDQYCEYIKNKDKEGFRVELMVDE